MQILKVIGLLMEYPDELLWECKEDALALIRRDAPILTDFTRNLLNAPLLDKQAEWCEVFDRGRTTSLLLFEHVHAESRDRGRAMVDLLAEYEKVGLQLNCRELPDYLPLYLEYLSVLPDDQAKEGLLNVAPILALLGGRLKQREAPWYALFDALLQLAGSPLSSDSVTKQIRSEERDDTRRALDAVWEEEQVKFIEDNATACDSSPLNQYQRRFSQMSRRSMSTSVREVGNDSVSERLFTISTRTCVARFYPWKLAALRLRAVYGVPPPARCWINAGWCYGRTCSISAFWGSSSVICSAC